MGIAFSTGAENVPELQRLRYDLSTIKAMKRPYLWLAGAPGTGRHTHAATLSENLNMVNMQVSELIRNESLKETDRGKLIRDALGMLHKRVPDFLVIDLIKEEMLRTSATAQGYIFNGFPCTVKQGQLFIEEIGDVDVIIYLTANIQTLLNRTVEKHSIHRTAQLELRKDILKYCKDVQQAANKFDIKNERVSAEGTMQEVYARIESVLTIRLDIQTENFNNSKAFEEPEHQGSLNSPT